MVVGVNGDSLLIQLLTGPAGLKPRIIGAGDATTPQKRRAESVHLLPICETNKVVYGSLQMIEVRHTSTTKNAKNFLRVELTFLTLWTLGLHACVGIL
jgi:hypothetical protein